jgi:exopolyphosphatase / guanosine-5'-triphosphate,3'-diphosphate pyrophosphatase
MRLAAIDIGSNAVRLLVEIVERTDGRVHVQKVAFIRVPLRLGEDVFDSGTISESKAHSLVKAMKAFLLLMEVHEVEEFRACATSAMREASNRDEVLALVRKETNIDIQILSGQDEAKLVFRNFSQSALRRQENYLYIDVGGGSTELTLIRKEVRVHSMSFPIGTVRSLKEGIPDEAWDSMKSFMKKILLPGEQLEAIGTGGNINRLHRMCGLPRHKPAPRAQLKSIRKELAGLTLEELQKKFGLKPDRADVIVPAADIYLKVMKLAGCSSIFVPKVGLADGIVLSLLEDLA